ncbi:hypothetical protein Bca4012_013490 [Brassica carinata]
MQSCWTKGYTKGHFEGDNQQLHNVLNKSVKDFAVVTNGIGEVRNKSVKDFAVTNWIGEVRKWEAKF